VVVSVWNACLRTIIDNKPWDVVCLQHATALAWRAVGLCARVCYGAAESPLHTYITYTYIYNPRRLTIARVSKPPRI